MTSWPRLRRRSEIRREALQPGAIQSPLVGVDQQRRPDLDDDAPGVGQAARGGFAVGNVHMDAILPFT